MSWFREALNAVSQTFKWWFIVAPWEQALRIRGGKHAKLMRAGVHFRIPFWDRVYRKSIRERVCGTTPLVVTSRDGRAYSLRAVVRFSIVDLEQLFNTAHAPDEVIGARVSTLLGQYIASSRSEYISPLAAQDYVNERIDLSAYGLRSTGAEIIDFAAVRTYRLITGAGSDGYWGTVNVSSHIDES